MTTRRREHIDTVYRRACRLMETGWASAQLNDELKEFVSIAFSVSTKTLESDIASEMKKMGVEAAVAAATVVDNKHGNTLCAAICYCGKPETECKCPEGFAAAQAVRTTCAQCGNELIDGRCRFINHRS